jgi:hypothetical protein
MPAARGHGRNKNSHARKTLTKDRHRRTELFLHRQRKRIGVLMPHEIHDFVCLRSRHRAGFENGARFLIEFQSIRAILPA